jgi:hypothetical protein
LETQRSRSPHLNSRSPHLNSRSPHLNNRSTHLNSRSTHLNSRLTHVVSGERIGQHWFKRYKRKQWDRNNVFLTVRNMK